MASYGNDNTGGGLNKGFFSRTLRKISNTNYGMSFDGMRSKNTVAVGINQIPTPAGSDSSMYDIFSRNAIAEFSQKKSISYLDATYPEKQRILREYARKDEIRDFITLVADEAIIYDEETTFCYPLILSEEFDEKLQEAFSDNFTKIYNRLGFNDGTVAWNYFRSLLIDGYLAFEIVYDDRQRDITHFQQLEPSTLLPAIDPNTGDKIWVQFPEQPEYRRVLLDSQIIYISYSSGTEYSETSYVENLIRPYNQLKMLEQTRIMFNIKQAMTYKKITVPVGGISQHMAEEQVSKLIGRYKEEISFNDATGVVNINGTPDIPYTKEYWFPEGEGGSPNVEIISQEGHNLNENDMLTWFYNALKRASKIPFTRFDKTNGGGNIFGDTSEVSRDELTFFHFINRIRTVFKEVMVKPWKIKMLLDYPELMGDENFLSNINVEFNGVNMFHEWKKLGNLSKRADILGTLSSSILDADGQPYFHIEWLVREVMKLDEETLEENERWKKKKRNGTAEETGGGDGGPSGGGMDMGGMDMGGDAPEPTGGAPEPPVDMGGGDTGGGDTNTDFDF